MNQKMKWAAGALIVWLLLSIRRNGEEIELAPIEGVTEKMDSVKALIPGAFERSVTSGPGAKYYDRIEQIGAANGLPENLLSRVAFQESHFRDDIISGRKISSAGAVGMFQIIPKWHQNARPLDWQAAADYAAKYLARLYRMFGTWSQAVAAYNWGEGNLKKSGLQNAPRETRNYYQQILADIGIEPGAA